VIIAVELIYPAMKLRDASPAIFFSLYCYLSRNEAKGNPKKSKKISTVVKFNIGDRSGEGYGKTRVTKVN
jgi:hypothetical protein